MKQWVVAFRGTLIQPLLEADDPMTLEQIAQVLLEWAPGNDQGLVEPGRAGSDVLRHFLTGRGETSVQRMVAGQRVPSRDVVLDLLQLVEDRIGRPDRAAVERLWALHRPALALEARALADAYDLIDERDAALLETQGLRRQADALGADWAREVFRLAQAGQQLTTAHRELVTAYRELEHSVSQAAAAETGEQQARSELERAADRLDRLKDAYDQLREQAHAAQNAAAEESEQWQERQALLLERLAQAQEMLTQTVQDAEQARQVQAQERHAADEAREESRAARQEAAASREAADSARQEAAADRARHHREQTSAQEKIHSAQHRYTQTLQELARLDAELRQVRGALKRSQKRLVHADAQLAQVLSERAVESDAQDVLSRALTAMQASGHVSDGALLPASPESTTNASSDAGAGLAPGAKDAGASGRTTPAASDGGREDMPLPRREGAAVPGQAERRTPSPTRRRPASLPRVPALRLPPHRNPGFALRLALVVTVAVTVVAGVPALVWWSWNQDTPLLGHESPTPRASTTASKAPSLPPRPSRDTVADIGDQPANTTAIMKLAACTRFDLSLRMTSAANTYTGRNPHLSLAIKAPKDIKHSPCRVNASRTQTVLTLTLADKDETVWKSSACTKGHDGPRWIQLVPDHPATVDFHWNRRALNKDCEKDPTAAPYGTYLAKAQLTDSTTPAAQTSFILARPAPKTTPTTPSPSRSTSSQETSSGGSNDSGGSVGGLLDDGQQRTPTPSATATPSQEANGAGGGGGGDNGGGFFGGPTG
ncbi:hypothetical protein [Streptomyces sp. NPDC002952]|uniref:hypothetical protein n=1 Tax=Streptomyces sp. NPDC002952 TaxID=3364673 RepID=UPI0036A82806